MSAETKLPPQVLIVSGLDPTGGAGFLADARVVADLGGRAVGGHQGALGATPRAGLLAERARVELEPRVAHPLDRSATVVR